VPEIELHPADMRARALRDGDTVRVTSRRGAALFKARASGELRPGDAFVAMHWGSRFIGGDGVNALTLPVLDPVSKQPELKHAAVQVERCTDDALPVVFPAGGRAVCACHCVTEDAICAALAAGAALAEVQEKLRCGTSCGSCLPEVRRLASMHRAAVLHGA
jgi:bacterioferritin-associated ferredoxin/formylmethanofuran dehydrogenase subunit D